MDLGLLRKKIPIILTTYYLLTGYEPSCAVISSGCTPNPPVFSTSCRQRLTPVPPSYVGSSTGCQSIKLAVIVYKTRHTGTPAHLSPIIRILDYTYRHACHAHCDHVTNCYLLYRRRRTTSALVLLRPEFLELTVPYITGFTEYSGLLVFSRNAPHLLHIGFSSAFLVLKCYCDFGYSKYDFM